MREERLDPAKEYIGPYSATPTPESQAQIDASFGRIAKEYTDEANQGGVSNPSFGQNLGKETEPKGGGPGAGCPNAANSKISTIRGRLPINSSYAGKTHPSGVEFTSQGFPNFSPYSEAEVQLNGLTGNYAKDAAMANKAVGLDSTPEGYVWHHVEDSETMQLVPRDIHNAARHTGGAAVIRNGGFDQ